MSDTCRKGVQNVAILHISKYLKFKFFSSVTNMGGDDSTVVLHHAGETFPLHPYNISYVCYGCSSQPLSLLLSPFKSHS